MTLDEFKQHRHHYEVFGSLPFEVMQDIFARAESTITAPVVEAPKKAKRTDSPEA